MSILINMEMPTSCRDCDFMQWGSVEPNRCGITDCFIGGDYEKRQDNCPLVPVPPHGRLIDADALFDFILNIYKTAQGDARKAYRDVLDTIVAAGDVIPAEEGE